MRGPAPFDHSARNAVGMPPLPASTAKPSCSSRSTYHAAERYSRKAGSAKSQIVALQDEKSSIRSSTHAKTSAVVAFTTLASSLAFLWRKPSRRRERRQPPWRTGLPPSYFRHRICGADSAHSHLVQFEQAGIRSAGGANEQCAIMSPHVCDCPACMPACERTGIRCFIVCDRCADKVEADAFGPLKSTTARIFRR